LMVIHRFFESKNTIAKMGIGRRQFEIGNIIGNRIFGRNSIALIGLKLSRWFGKPSRPPR